MSKGGGHRLVWRVWRVWRVSCSLGRLCGQREEREAVMERAEVLEVHKGGVEELDRQSGLGVRLQGSITD